MSWTGLPQRSLAGRAGLPLVLLLGGLCVARVLADLLPMLLRDDLYAGDAAQHIWWMYRFADPTLFAGDPIAAYYAMSAYSPPGYQWLFRLLTPLADAQHVSEVLAIALALASVAFAAALGHACGRKTGVAAALCLFLFLHAGRYSAGGFPRSFGLVLMLAGALALCNRRWTALGLTMLLSALLYPPVVLNLAPATAMVLAVGWQRHRRLPRGFVPFALLSVVTIGLLASVYLRPIPGDLGRWFTYDELRGMPEWQADGRSAFFLPFEDFYFSAASSGTGLTPTHTAIVLLLLLATLALCRTAIPLEAWALLGGALAMWLLAHATLFKLYLPGRYLAYALPVFGFIWSARVAREMKLWLLARRAETIHRLRRTVVGGAALASIFLLAVDVRQALAEYRRQPGHRRWANPAGYESVLAYLRTLPPTTLVAAHPTDANAIPLRTGRPVLVNTETSIAFHTGFYGQMRHRLDSAFGMLYATDFWAVDAIAVREGVDVFVLDTSRLARPDERPYYEPFRTTNRSRIAAGRDGFALLSPPPGRVLMSAGEWVVLRVGGGAQ